MKPAKSHLTAGQRVAVALLAGPPLVLVLCDIGPGHWINTAQDALIGGHSLSLSFLAVSLLEFVLLGLVAMAARWLTGRTLVDLITKKKSDK
jgi:hypothetical protein